ncbi:InlB B-repeat-containing protein [Sporolactobacillus laevolacticus]|nr:InlB B-repeat-containing protein [Sporolactobacillus laevolacticus]
MHSKKYPFIFLAFIVLLSPIIQLFTYPQVGLAAASSFAGGTGTAEDPWIIATPQQLDNVRNDLSAHYQLVNDIDLSSYVSSGGAGYHGGAGWEPIGNDLTSFTGTFDGQGHKIIGLQINRPSSNFIGLFGDVGLGGKVENIGIEGGSVSGNMHTGGLTGANDGGSIVNSYSSCIVYGDRGTGDLVGRNLGNITNSYTTGDVNGRDGAGGLVGFGYGGSINNTYATGRVNGTSSVGSLVGINAGSTILNSFYNSETTGQSDTGRGTPKTTVEMKTISTYTDAGWDFDNTWGINSAVNGGYPFFVSHYSVTYNDNSGTAGSVPTDGNDYKENDTVTVMNNIGDLRKDGFTFAGWNTKPDGSGTTYTPGAHLTIGASNVTLYAKWTIDVYLITYNGNGSNEGNITYTTPLSEPGTQFEIAVNQFTRSDYSFTGWNTKADGSGTTYQPGDKYTLGAFNVTMYAQWVPVARYHVAYNGNGNDGGFAPPQSMLAAPGDTVTVQGNPGGLSRAGYTFEGWNTESDGSGTTFHVNDHLTISESNVTLYAKWKINSYTISFNSNGGSVVPNKNSDYGTTISAPSAPTKEGYTFDGWYKDKDLTETWDFNKNTVVGDTILYAKWTANRYAVHFDSNGGSAAADVGTDYGNMITPPAAPTKKGYTFVEWYKNKDLMKVWTFDKDTVIQNTTLYAKWAINSYSVTYDGNGSDGGSAPAEETYPYNSDVTIPENTGLLSRTGFAFAGWNTKADGSGTSYVAGNRITMGLSNVTLYAQWKINHYMVDFDSNGGSSVVNQTVDYGAQASRPTAPTRIGYTFAGWYKDKDLIKVWTFDKDTVIQDTTLYAKWTFNQNTVNFDSNGGRTQRVNQVPTNQAQVRTELTAQTVDKTRLQAKSDTIDKEGLTSNDFTGSSWNALQSAQKAAKVVLSDPNATQVEVDAAYAKLTRAYEALVEESKVEQNAPVVHQTVDQSREEKTGKLPTTGDGSDFFAMLSGLALFIFAGLIAFITRRRKKNS